MCFLLKGEDLRDRCKQTTFFVACLGLLPFVFIWLYCMPDVIAARQRARPDYPYPTFSDLYLTGYSLLVFIPARILLSEYVFKPFGEWVLPQNKWTEECRRDRVDRFGAVIFKLLYFIVISVVGYFVLSPTNFLPPVLGGSGDMKNVWEDFPFPPVTPWLKEYYLVELGYHTQSLIFFIILSHRNDYLEMMLHHSCALFLVVFSYLGNFVRIGSLVLIVHDLADIFGYATKAIVDTKHTTITLMLYSALLYVWAATRFYVFPFYIIATVYDGLRELPQKVPEHFISFDWRFLLNMLYVLLFLHVYWYCLFIYMGFSFLKTGVPQDLQHKIVEKKVR